MLFIISGVAGSGKNTIANEIIKRVDNIDSIPSYTTRSPREGDIPGKTYVFVTKEEFEQKIKDGEIYEYDIHHNNYYGTSKDFFNQAAARGHIIKDIDVNGTEKLKECLKDVKVVTLFLRVPKEELRHRLENRIDKPSKEDIDLRLSRFDYEESKIGLYDYVLKNDDLEKCVSIVQSIVENEIKSE